jgi:hypothetical protein
MEDSKSKTGKCKALVSTSKISRIKQVATKLTNAKQIIDKQSTVIITESNIENQVIVNDIISNNVVIAQINNTSLVLDKPNDESPNVFSNGAALTANPNMKVAPVATPSPRIMSVTSMSKPSSVLKPVEINKKTVQNILANRVETTNIEVASKQQPQQPSLASFFDYYRQTQGPPNILRKQQIREQAQLNREPGHLYAVYIEKIKEAKSLNNSRLQYQAKNVELIDLTVDDDVDGSSQKSRKEQLYKSNSMRCVKSSS